jgi:hypothetical protein
MKRQMGAGAGGAMPPGATQPGASPEEQMKRQMGAGAGGAVPPGATRPGASPEEEMKRQMAGGAGGAVPPGAQPGASADAQEQMRRQMAAGANGAVRPGATQPGASPEEQEQMRRQMAAGAGGAIRPGAEAGQAPPGALPGFNGAQAGAPGAGNASPFGNEVAAGSPEYPIQQLLQRLNAGDLGDAADLFSRKAAGKAKTLREGKASEEFLSELKSDVAGTKALPAMTLFGKHVIVLEEADGGAGQVGAGQGGYAASPQYAGNNRRGQQPKGKSTRKVQFTVVSEGDQMVIQDIKVTKGPVKVRAPNSRRR